MRKPYEPPPITGPFPPQIGPSRKWKARKRRELAALEKALDAVRWGCFYTPIKDVGTALDTVRAWREACSVKSWGR